MGELRYQTQLPHDILSFHTSLMANLSSIMVENTKNTCLVMVIKTKSRIFVPSHCTNGIMALCIVEEET